ncbi:MAG: RNA methyltransferase, partial [Chitinophagaceae bacterium]
FRRDPEAVREWSEDAVRTCSLRQQRILADAYGCLKKDGILIYSTCSYSPEEDEEISDWLMSNYQLESIQITTRAEWNIVETVSGKHGAFGYRFFPDKLKGEGLYVACFRKKDGDDESRAPYGKSKLEKATSAEKAIVANWIEPGVSLNYYRHQEDLFAFPSSLDDSLVTIRSSLNIRMAGITIGKTVRDELIPDHHLAVSGIVNPELPSISLKKEDALQYLRKEEVTITATHKGWSLVKYNSLTLGWVKILQNRVNNYYPKEWRILKSGNS